MEGETGGGTVVGTVVVVVADCASAMPRTLPPFGGDSKWRWWTRLASTCSYLSLCRRRRDVDPNSSECAGHWEACSGGDEDGGGDRNRSSSRRGEFPAKK